ncbi:TetR/AcrR family transcriptional regulator [Comamonas jiangduensis]|uniref:TetR/AcrR family transcriptional regulator n=1 Tax=Comamonas jiangduensis TaxID=1194168 RepID=UPI003BF7D8F7
MSNSPVENLTTRERILNKAAEQARAEGLDSISVNKLMRSVNLTHGGFYGHFASRSELVAEALERALVDGEANARAAAAQGKPRDFASMVKSYLSRGHRDSRQSGCAISALAAEVSRSDEAARKVMETHIEAYFKQVGAALPDHDEQHAMVAVSAMVGALMLSRVYTDTKRSDQLLNQVKAFLTDSFGSGK